MSTSQRLIERVAAARSRRFVGRDAERNLFRSAIVSSELPFYILYVWGPGGVGKTTLLREFVRISSAEGVAAIYLDGRNVDPAPESFSDALARSMGLQTGVAPTGELARRGTRHVLIIDTYEALTQLDGWLREVFLPDLPEDTMIVLADRQGPSSGWRTDPGWQALIRTMPLRNLTREESTNYLALRDIPPGQHSGVLDFTHGHPLALSLVADLFDQRPEVSFKPENAPDVVKRLLDQLLQKVPSPAHRAALEACSLVRLTTEPLLGAMLATGDAHELFDWLRGLSFVESGPMGIFPHDLAREALTADLRWRNPDWYAELHRRARGYYSGRLQQTRGQEQQVVLFDFVFLHRDNSVIKPFFEWREDGSRLPDTLRSSDREEIVRIVRMHEGEDSAELAGYWLERQPEGFTLFRDSDRRPLGFMSMVALHRTTQADLARDPAVHATSSFLRMHASLRPGEGATLFRFWMARDSYQSVSSVQSLIFVNAARHYLVTQSLAYTFFPCADPDFWASGFAYVDLERIPEADFVVGSQPYGVYGHDWRRVPPAAWLALLGEREISADALSARPTEIAIPMVVLSQPDFEGAVREALQKLSHPDGLRSNPLLGSRIVIERVASNGGNLDRSAALASLLIEAAESLRSAPRQEKAYQALYHTYIRPAPTQEAASEILDLPFSTFRRHLKTGILRVTELLWAQEIGGDK